MRLVRTTTLLLAFVPLFITCRNRHNTVSTPPSDPRWTTIDSLRQLGQYASALERSDALLAEARTAGDWRTEYRAWTY